MSDQLDLVEVQKEMAEDSLVRMAIDKNLDTDKLEKVIALFNQQQDRQRKEDFERHFGEMQKELPTVNKNSTAKKKDGGKAYDYVTLDNLQTECKPVISKHGFSYSWREEALTDGAKRTWLDISGYGYTKSNYFDSPKIGGTDWQNAIQVAGSQSTYGRRYTFIAGFGIIVLGEDMDGNILDEGSLEMDLRTYIHSGKLSPEAVKIILDELDRPERDMSKLRNYWKRARAKAEGK